MNVHKLRRLLIGAVALTACVEASKEAPTTDTTISRATPAVSATSVNQATYGMRSRIRWILSRDSSAILVMVDAVSIENDPLPNAFFFGSETRNFQTRMDNVWDVAPAPDWQSLAFSRAHIVRGEGEDSIPPAAWVALARTTGMDTATLIQSSFPASGMVMMRAIAQPGIIRIPADIRAPGATDAAAPRLFPIARGWQVRWTVDGANVALGNNPAKIQDDEKSESWAALDPKSSTYHGTLPVGARLAVPRWKDGPVLESGTPTDLEGGNPIAVTAGKRSFSIESQRGVITARETTPGVSPGATPFTIGSGRALVSTRGGRYIVALAPRRNAVAHEIPIEVVVYTVAW